MTDHNTNQTAVLNTQAKSLPSRAPLGSESIEPVYQQTYDESLDGKAGFVAEYPRLHMPAPNIPPEILEHILSDLRDDAVSVDDCSEENPSMFSESIEQIVLRWITVTHVCRSWRKIATDIPALWTRIPLNLGPSWIKTCLSRSHSHPISISAHSSLELRALHSISGFFSRIQNIHIAAEPETIKALLEMLIEPAPLLRSLTIHSNDSGVELRDMPRIGETLFSGHAPLLNDLYITNCSIIYGSTVLQRISRNLTTLHLSINFYSPEDDEFGIYHSLVPLVKLLTETPLLQVLHIRDPCRAGISDATPPYVSLPNLRSLMLIGGYLKCCMLNHYIIDTQPNNFLDLQCHMELPDPDEELFGHIAATLQDHVFRLGPDVHLSHLDVEIDVGQFMLFAKNIARLKGIIFSEWEAGWDRAIQQSIYVLPLTASSTLRMNIRSSVDAAALIRMLGTDWAYDIRQIVPPMTLLPITSLTITGFDFDFRLEELCAALKAYEDSSAEQDISLPAILPALSSLCIESFDFDLLQPDQHVACQEELVRVLDLRNHVGRPIRKMELRNWSGTSRTWYRDLAAQAADYQTTVSVDEFPEDHSVA